jgi:hypothetical protein
MCWPGAPPPVIWYFPGRAARASPGPRPMLRQGNGSGVRAGPAAHRDPRRAAVHAVARPAWRQLLLAALDHHARPGGLLRHRLGQLAAAVQVSVSFSASSAVWARLISPAPVSPRASGPQSSRRHGLPFVRCSTSAPVSRRSPSPLTSGGAPNGGCGSRERSRWGHPRWAARSRRSCYWRRLPGSHARWESSNPG